MTTSAATARALLAELADAWNRGDPAAGAECFTVDAVYLEPPDRQRYVGREQLFGFFGGDTPGGVAMSMTWHHLAVDEAADRVFGEYTFTGNNTYHGVVVIQLRNGRISSWREYQYKSTLPFAEFAGDSLRRPRHR
jgi:ketosteroid isomerase-like protein